jgi:ethylbenzene dioxygenase ferredoxin subunit
MNTEPKREEEMIAEPPWLRLCSVEEVSEGLPLQCELEGTAYAVFQLGADYFVIADRCSHGPGSLSEGDVVDGEVECPFHRGRFDIRTGCPTLAPCTVAVRTWNVRVVEGGICIQPAAACVPVARAGGVA